jgi:hypothetical protein
MLLLTKKKNLARLQFCIVLQENYLTFFIQLIANIQGNKILAENLEA